MKHETQGDGSMLHSTSGVTGQAESGQRTTACHRDAGGAPEQMYIGAGLSCVSAGVALCGTRNNQQGRQAWQGEVNKSQPASNLAGRLWQKQADESMSYPSSQSSAVHVPLQVPVLPRTCIAVPHLPCISPSSVATHPCPGTHMQPCGRTAAPPHL